MVLFLEQKDLEKAHFLWFVSLGEQRNE